MENNVLKTTARTASVTVLIGSFLMIGGAALMGISGADLDKAIYQNDIQNYLTTASNGKTLLILNLTFWIFGVILIGTAGMLMANLNNKKTVIAKITVYNYSIAIPVVVVAYTIWLSIVIKLSGREEQTVLLITEVLGWIASRADWIATVLVLGTGPLLISVGGRNSWIPRWLRIWSYVCFITGLLNITGMFTGNLTTFGFLIIPAGMGWMVASFFVLNKLYKK